MAGCASLTAIAEFDRDRGNALAFPLGFRRSKTPNASALGKIFRRLDTAALDAAHRTWLIARGATNGHMMDGETLTGSRDGDVRGRHLVNGYATKQAAVVGLRGDPHHQRAQGGVAVARSAGAGRVNTADATFAN